MPAKAKAKKTKKAVPARLRGAKKGEPRPRYTEDERARFAAHVRGGASIKKAAEAVGVSTPTGYQWAHGLEGVTRRRGRREKGAQRAVSITDGVRAEIKLTPETERLIVMASLSSGRSVDDLVREKAAEILRAALGKL